MAEDAWVAPGLVSSGGTHYLLEGPEEGRQVVFVHGIGTAHFYFEAMAAFVRGLGYRTLRYDNLGMGFSHYPQP